MTDAGFNCLYCGKDHQHTESSLEHAIPQFMGGDSAPNIFKINNVCKSCNNNLGLWVDASYAKSWFITNCLSDAARLLCIKSDDPGLPLICMGNVRLSGLNIPVEYMAEHWIGPSGETVVWVRPHDERMDYYAGGNPITTKRKPSVAYFFPVSDNPDKHMLGLNSFHRSLKKRNVRKILCAQLHDSQGSILCPSIWGFDLPTAEELSDKEIIKAAIDAGSILVRVSLNTKFDQRFMCKLALAVGYSLFGEQYLSHNTALEARKGVWPCSSGTTSVIRGSSTLYAGDGSFAKVIGYPGAVVIIVMRIDSQWVMSVSINEKLPFTIEIGPSSMQSTYINSEEGYALLLFPYLESSVELTVAELVSHKLGGMKSLCLENIDIIREASDKYNAKLASFDYEAFNKKKGLS